MSGIVIVKLVVISLLSSSGSYVETATPVSATFKECEIQAEKLAGPETITYCLESKPYVQK